MDAALLSAAASMSLYVPKHVLGYHEGTQKWCMASVIGLSLGLFSLSLVEAAPPSWMMLLSHSDDAGSSGDLLGGMLSIARVYWLFLWALSIVILVVFPATTGASFADSFQALCCSKKTLKGDDGDDKRKKSRWKQTWRSSPWWIRFVGSIVYVLARNTWRISCKLCRAESQPPLDVLRTRTFSDDELELSGDVEAQGLVNKTVHQNTSNRRSHLWIVVGAIIGISVVLLVAGNTGPWVVQNQEDMNLLSVLVSWLCAIGLLISSLLNGFGSVSMPYTCLVGLYLNPVRPEVISKLESELQSVVDAMNRKKTELRELKVSVRQDNNVNTAASSGKANFATSTLRHFGKIGDEVCHQRQILKTEIDFLENLCIETKADIEELRYSQSIAAAARTRMGQIRSYAGLIFSVILLIRLVSAGVSIWKSYTIGQTHRKVEHKDVVTKTILWLTGHDFVPRQDFAALSQVVSLGLTALLSFSQTRFFFRALSFVHRRISRLYNNCSCVGKQLNGSEDDRARNGGMTPGIFSQILAGATGCYFLSCMVLTKTMLPEKFCREFNTAMGGSNIFTIQTSIINKLFCCSAGVSLFILAMLFGIQRQNTLRHTTEATGVLSTPRAVVDAV